MSDPSARLIELTPLEVHDSEFQLLLDKLISLIDGKNLKVTADQARLCLQHLLYVEQVNHVINLTRITDLDEALVLHILDSLMLLPVLPDSCTSYLDMGTGAGFPGIPLAICTSAQGTLLDSVGKKVNAVQTIADELGLRNVSTAHDRLESYALSHTFDFDVVVARALASLPVLLEYARPFLKIGAFFYVMKATPERDEIIAGKKVCKMLGYSFKQRVEFDLPNNLGHRLIYIYEVVTKSSIKLPRQNGLARKKPLA